MTDSSIRPIVVGTRGSALALWQAEYVVRRLRARHPDRRFEIKPIRTRGDVVREAALADIGARGVFVKEIQSALLSGEVDLGVHSLKDLPSEPAPGVALAAVSPREDPRDVLVSHHGCTLAELPGGARLGTSSPRRSAQLRAFRPDLVVESIRGNVDTRVRKARGPELDGVVLAAAGLRRLGLADQISEYIAPSVLLPAPGQGIIGVEARADDAECLALAASIDDAATHLAARAERAFVRALGGGCTTPLAAYAQMRADTIHIQGALASPDGRCLLREELVATAADPELAGIELARRLLADGGDVILAEIKHAGGGVDDPG